MPQFVRRVLLFALVLGLVGTQAELLLLGHYEDAWQYVPVVLIGTGLLVLIAHAVRPAPGTVRGVHLLMVFFVVAGAVGTWMHYHGNSAFELEVDPELPRWPLFKAAISGVTPVLAPGSMIQLGLIGLAWCFRHPALGGTKDTTPSSADLAKAVVAARPFASILGLDSLLGKTLTKEQRTELYKKTFIQINLNSASREEILLIPGSTNRHVREFQEYRPFKALAVFHREMRKYWDEAEVTRLESYVFVPLDLNSATDEDIMTVPGMTARMLREFKEYRPYDAVERYTREMQKYVGEKEAKRLTRYVAMPPKSY